MRQISIITPIERSIYNHHDQNIHRNQQKPWETIQKVTGHVEHGEEYAYSSKKQD
ncbi:hypothetical protein [Neolewinella aurantiaca]|uniref:hypothetical protein n=1 Tax=Neolewinella aurantiaca TaxID=2602767 RepID=UPI001C9CBF78|nr:hypothetical protein [Neolewinella aurantiaca]